MIPKQETLTIFLTFMSDRIPKAPMDKISLWSKVEGEQRDGTHQFPCPDSTTQPPGVCHIRCPSLELRLQDK